MIADIFEKPGSPSNIGAINFGVQALAAAGNLDSNSTIIVCDASAASFALQLPPAAQDAGRTVFIVLTTTASAHTLTLTPFAGDTVGGGASLSLTAAGKFAILSSKGNDWKVVAQN
jgi:hypothetical protein